MTEKVHYLLIMWTFIILKLWLFNGWFNYWEKKDDPTSGKQIKLIIQWFSSNFFYNFSSFLAFLFQNWRLWRFIAFLIMWIFILLKLIFFSCWFNYRAQKLIIISEKTNQVIILHFSSKIFGYFQNYYFKLKTEKARCFYLCESLLIWNCNYLDWNLYRSSVVQYIYIYKDKCFLIW